MSRGGILEGGAGSSDAQLRRAAPMRREQAFLRDKCCMDGGNGWAKRRTFHWPVEARQFVTDHRQRNEKARDYRPGDRAQILVKLVQISGNPRGACLRFLRPLGVAEKRSYREWTTREQQRLIELIDDVPVEEAARILRRPPASVRSMLHRLGLGVRQSREWFTISLLAQALHIGRDEVHKWVDRG